MRLQRIYSSKLYVTSTRKDRIHAAMQDPINAELVKQLADYLDEDSKVELKRALSTQKAKNAGGGKSEGSVIPSDSDESFIPSGGGPSGGPSFTGSIADDFGGDDLADIEPMPDEGGAEASEPVAESKKIRGKSIKATSSVVWTTLEDITSECDTIQGTLNAREDTKGVARLQVKETELWIYFNDDVNLNDKMIDVIEVLNSTGYTYLAFSRLARSNNAIVFDIDLGSSENIKAQTDEK